MLPFRCKTWKSQGICSRGLRSEIVVCFLRRGGAPNWGIYFTVELGAALKKISLSQSRGPGHPTGLQETPPRAPVQCPLYSIKAPPPPQGRSSPDELELDKQVAHLFKKKSACPFQVRGSQGTGSGVELSPWGLSPSNLHLDNDWTTYTDQWGPTLCFS